MKDELKACPFCGAPAEEGTDKKWGSFVFCTNEEWCNAPQHGFVNEDRAIAAWNTRAAISASSTEERLREAAERLVKNARYLPAQISSETHVDRRDFEALRAALSPPSSNIEEG